MRRVIKNPLTAGGGALLLLLLLLISAHSAAAAQPSLVTEDQPRFTLPPAGGGSSTFQFLLFSTGGEIKGVTVTSRQVKNPGGQVLPTDAVKATLESTTVGPVGVNVTLEVARQHFTAPGEYRAVLSFGRAGAAAVLNSTVVINHPAADINADELKDRTIALTRPFPGLAFDATAPLTVRETTGRSDLSGLEIVEQDIMRGGTKEVAAGKLTITPAAAATPATDAATPAAARTGTATYDLKFSDLSQAGTFDTGIVVKSTGFSGAKSIPLKLTVTDFLFWPLLAIFVGVSGGFLVRRIANAETPRDLNQLRILRIKSEIERYRGLIRRPESLNAVEGLIEQLGAAEEANEIGNFAEAATRLTQIESALDTFRKAQATLEDEAQKRLAALRGQAAALSAAQPSAEEAADLEAAKRRLDDAESLLEQGRVDEAALRLEGEAARLNGITRRRLEAQIEPLYAELELVENIDADKQERIEALKSSIREHMAGGKFGNVRAALSELRILADSLKTRRRGARASEEEELAAETTPVTPPAPPQPTRINVETPVDQRVSNTSVTFTLVDPQGLVAPTDELRWHFGDVGSFVPGRTQTTHTYRRAGRYQVRVEVMRNGALHKTLQEVITILPGPTEVSRALVRRRLRRNELILSAVALAIAVITGLILLYVNKPFGTLSDYLLAILWGFGIDNSVKGVADVFGKVKASGGAS